MKTEQPTSKERTLPKTSLEWIAYALNDAATALPVLFTMLAKIGARDGAMVADEILGYVRCAQKECAHLIEDDFDRKQRADALLKIVDELDGEFDRQLYGEMVRRDHNPHDDDEFSVNITAKQLRALTDAVRTSIETAPNEVA